MKARMLFILVALVLGATHARAAGRVDLGNEIEVTLKKAATQHSRMVEVTPAHETVASYNSAWEKLKRRKRVAYAKNDDVQIVLRPTSGSKAAFKKSVVVR